MRRCQRSSVSARARHTLARDDGQPSRVARPSLPQIAHCDSGACASRDSRASSQAGVSGTQLKTVAHHTKEERSANASERVSEGRKPSRSDRDEPTDRRSPPRPLASLPVETVMAAITPNLQRYLAGPLLDAAREADRTAGVGNGLTGVRVPDLVPCRRTPKRSFAARRRQLTPVLHRGWNSAPLASQGERLSFDDHARPERDRRGRAHA